MTKNFVFDSLSGYFTLLHLIIWNGKYTLALTRSLNISLDVGFLLYIGYISI